MWGSGGMASLAMSRGTLQRVLGDVLRVMRLLYGKRVMAGSEAQLFWMMKRMLRSWSLSFPEVDILASWSAKPTILRLSSSTYAHFSPTSCQGISAPRVRFYGLLLWPTKSSSLSYCFYRSLFYTMLAVKPPKPFQRSHNDLLKCQ